IATNFLYMLKGNLPSDHDARVFDACLILHADHEFNASTFAARVVAGTLADMYAAVTGAIAALSGPLHGRANPQVLHVLLESEKGLHPNVDFYSASTYYMMGIPLELYTPIFAVSRISGWTGHILEQYTDNKLIRPRAEYTGPRDVKYVPLDER